MQRETDLQEEAGSYFALQSTRISSRTLLLALGRRDVQKLQRLLRVFSAESLKIKKIRYSICFTALNELHEAFLDTDTLK